MFSLFKSKTAKHFNADFFPFSTDIHSHILPGIDDGSPDVETSIMLVSKLQELGIKRSIATPHIISDLYRNDEKIITAALEKLRRALETQGIEYPVSAAAEYMIDSSFLEKLKQQEKMLTLHENYLLVEFSYAARPDNIEEPAFQIITNGYSPVLAHPERYGYYHNDLNMYHRLKEIGFQFQLNLLSLTGYYGKAVQKTAAWLIKNDFVSYLGTDLHHIIHMDAMHLPANRKIFEELLEERMFNEEFR